MVSETPISETQHPMRGNKILFSQPYPSGVDLLNFRPIPKIVNIDRTKNYFAIIQISSPGKSKWRTQLVQISANVESINKN